MEAKKNKSKEYERFQLMFRYISLSISLLLIILAFNWKTHGDLGIVDLTISDVDFDPIIESPRSKQEPPPPPIKTLPKLKVVSEEQQFVPDEFKIDAEFSSEIEVFEDLPPDLPKEEPEKIWDFVEKQPEFPGGISAFYQYVSEEIIYPRLARNMGVEGKVFLRFIVDRDGSITEVEVIKGIGAGCDEEAKRVLINSPRFIPGKQRGRAVKVKMVLPIMFKLQN